MKGERQKSAAKRQQLVFSPPGDDAKWEKGKGKVKKDYSFEEPEPKAGKHRNSKP